MEDSEENGGESNFLGRHSQCTEEMRAPEASRRRAVKSKTNTTRHALKDASGDESESYHVSEQEDQGDSDDGEHEEHASDSDEVCG